MKKIFTVLFVFYSAILSIACSTQTREQAQASEKARKALEEGKNYLRLSINASNKNDYAGACAYTSKAIDVVRAIDQSALDNNDRKIISDTIDFGSSARDRICKKAEGQDNLRIRKGHRAQATFPHR
ncbi:MAG: hypothetical protein ACOYB3_11115 [Azonexus sp.]